MGSLLHGLGAFCVRLRWVVLAAWLALAIGITVVVGQVGAETNNDLTLPGTDSQAAFDLLAKSFPPQQNGSSPVVYHATTGRLDDNGPNQKAIDDSYKEMLTVKHVASVTNPLANPAAGLLSADGTYAFMPVLLDVDSGDLSEHTAEEVFLVGTSRAEAVGLESAVGGPVGSALSSADTESSEALGLIAAMVILTFTFGTLVAMGMPIITAIVGLLTGLGIIGLLGHLIDIPTVGPTLATMIGLGVGIDYALFLVTKHRDQVHKKGMDPRSSIAEAIATSGGAVVFAGGTVVIALLSLAVAGIPFVTALGYACAIAVLTAVIAAITLLPAVLAIVGGGIDRLALPAFLRPKPKAEGEGFWAGWAAMVVRHPIACTVAAAALLIPLIIPVFSLTLGQEDIGVTPTSTTERQAFDLISAGFGPGYNGPLVVAVKMEPVAEPSAEYTEQYDQALALQADLEEAQATLPEEAAALEKQQNALLKQQNELLKQQKQLEKQGKALESQAAALARQEASLRAQEASLRAEAAQLQRERDRLVAEAKRLAAREKELVKKLAANRAKQTVVEDALAVAVDPVVIARLEARLADLEAKETALKKEIKAGAKEAKALLARAKTLLDRKAVLERQAAELQRQADELKRQSDVLKAQAAQLAAESSQLAKQANQLNNEATDLQTQADELTQQQELAQEQQAEAEQLQAELTAELTMAGGDPRGTDPRIVTLQLALATPEDVQVVVPPQINKSGDAIIISVIAKTRPADPLTAALVEQLREEVIGPALTPGMVADVGGNTASNVDLATLITQRLPLVILTVIGLSFLLLLVAFRSLLVPVQAAVTNLLSAAAAFGVVTAVFQWGWGLDAIGLDSPYGTVPIASYVPLMMFAALFGLSMDYEVFFVSHVQGHHAEGMSHRDAVRAGLGSSSKVIAAAALIMISVFGSFIINDDPIVKQFGVGLSVAVALAAILVLLLAPAMLTLFGETTWRLPGFLDRLLPDLDLEGHRRSAAADAAASDEPELAPEPA